MLLSCKLYYMYHIYMKGRVGEEVRESSGGRERERVREGGEQEDGRQLRREVLVYSTNQYVICDVVSIVAVL